MDQVELTKSAEFLVIGCQNGLFGVDSRDILRLLQKHSIKYGMTLKESAIRVLSESGVSFAEQYDRTVGFLKGMLNG